MKKTILIAAFAALCLGQSCVKEIENTPAAEPVAISATLTDILTKVGFAPEVDAQSRPILSLTWAEGDMIRVYDHDDHSRYQDFTLAAGSVGQKTGVFNGTAISAAAYDVEVVNPALSYASLTQPSDGATGDLKYVASVENIPDYTFVKATDV